MCPLSVAWFAVLAVVACCQSVIPPVFAPLPCALSSLQSLSPIPFALNSLTRAGRFVVASSCAQEGYALCEDCEAGKFTDLTRQKACQLCKEGEFQNVTGTTVCIKCNPGSCTSIVTTHCLQQHAVAVWGSGLAFALRVLPR